MDFSPITRLVFPTTGNKSVSNIVTYDGVSNDQEEVVTGLSAAFAPVGNAFSKRVQFTLDKGLRGVIERVQSRLELSTLSGVFQLGLGLLHHLLNHDLRRSELVIERAGKVIFRPSLVSVLSYVTYLSQCGIGTDRYQVALDETQYDLLMKMQKELGMNAISDVARFAVIILFAVAENAELGDSLVLTVDRDEFEFKL